MVLSAMACSVRRKFAGAHVHTIGGLFGASQRVQHHGLAVVVVVVGHSFGCIIQKFNWPINVRERTCDKCSVFFLVCRTVGRTRLARANQKTRERMTTRTRSQLHTFPQSVRECNLPYVVFVCVSFHANNWVF